MPQSSSVYRSNPLAVTRRIAEDGTRRIGTANTFSKQTGPAGRIGAAREAND